MAIINGGEVTYKGCVIRTWEHNGYDDSDFYADCVDVENGKIVTIEYDTTRCGGCGYAEADLTAENYAKYLHNGGRDNELAEAVTKAAFKAKEICKGKEVIVIAGRKVKHGVVGEVFWTKAVNYDCYRRWWNEELKIGIKDADGNVYWTYAKNVKVLDYRKYLNVAKIAKDLKKLHGLRYRRLLKEERAIA